MPAHPLVSDLLKDPAARIVWTHRDHSNPSRRLLHVSHVRGHEANPLEGRGGRSRSEAGHRPRTDVECCDGPTRSWSGTRSCCCPILLARSTRLSQFERALNRIWRRGRAPRILAAAGETGGGAPGRPQAIAQRGAGVVVRVVARGRSHRRRLLDDGDERFFFFLLHSSCASRRFFAGRAA